jgi:hypothetical protein
MEMTPPLATNRLTSRMVRIVGLARVGSGSKKANPTIVMAVRAAYRIMVRLLDHMPYSQATTIVPGIEMIEERKRRPEAELLPYPASERKVGKNVKNPQFTRPQPRPYITTVKVRAE